MVKATAAPGRRRFLLCSLAAGTSLSAGATACGGVGWDEEAELRAVKERRMLRHHSNQRLRPMVAYLVTTLAACVATLITAFLPATTQAAFATPVTGLSASQACSDDDRGAVVTYVGTPR